MSDAGSARSIEAKRLQLNLKVLQRHDPSIQEILDSTSYVVLYKYVPAPAPSDADSQDSPADMQWVKTSIEGSMFIYRRSQAPFYGFFILNRHGVENFSHYLEDEANLELTPEYIIVQSEDEQIKGIWIFEEEHRERLGEKMLELSRLSKHGTTLSKAVASVPNHASNNSPGSTGSAKPLPAGQSISLDMLFGSSGENNGQQNHSNGNEPNLCDQQPQPASASKDKNQQGMNLLDSLFADISGNTQTGNTGTARPSPTFVGQSNAAPMGTSSGPSADEDALRNLLGLGSGSPRDNKPSPGLYQQPQQIRQSPHANYATSVQQQGLSQSQRPQPPQQPYLQPVLEPLAPRPQRMAQFDSVGYEAPAQQPTYQQQQQQQQNLPIDQHAGMRYMQPQHAPPPPHLPQHHHQHHQQRQNAPPAPMHSQQSVSAPLMPSVLLNKNQTGQPSPQSQPRTMPANQPQQMQPSYGQQYGSQPQNYQQPTAVAGYTKYGSAQNIPRVKSPLSQSHTYGYASSDYSNSDVRYGAQSIPPPPVPPVESRPLHFQHEQGQRRGSGDRMQQALSPRSSPQTRQDQLVSPNQAISALNSALEKTSLYQRQGPSGVGGPYDRPVPVDAQTFRNHLSACLQDERFLAAVYRSYLDHLEGK